MEAKVSGSMIPIIMGLNPYSTIFDLWCRLRNDEKVPENEAMRVGTLLEPALIDAYAISGMRQYALQHPEKPYFSGTLDVLGDDFVWEIKTTRNANIEAYFAQLQWYLWLCNLNGLERRGKLIIYRYTLEPEQMLELIMGYGEGVWSAVGTSSVIDVQPDEFVWEYMDKLAEDFYQSLVWDTPPKEPENLDEVKKMFQRAIEGAETVATDADIALVERLRSLETEAKKIEDEIDRIKTQIMLRMRDSAFLVAPTGEKLVSWKEQTRSSFDFSKFKIEHPEVVKKYTTSTKTRIFKILKGGKK